MKYPNGHRVACFNYFVIYSPNLNTVVGVDNIVFEELAVGHVQVVLAFTVTAEPRKSWSRFSVIVRKPFQEVARGTWAIKFMKGYSCG